ncbi:MAG: cobalamin biosynthesis protein [Pseudomonadota bacterium]
MIVAGFGFRSAAQTASLRDALARTGGTPNLLATAADKASSAAFTALGAELSLPTRGVDPAGQHTLTQSAASQAARGTGSVAEASALAAAGPGARLLGRRVISADRQATCALAIGAAP